MPLFSFEIIEVILRRFLCKESKRYTVFFIRILTFSLVSDIDVEKPVF